jgi:hypothetical protein
MLTNLKARFPQLAKLMETIEGNLTVSITTFVVAILAIVSTALQSHIKVLLDDWNHRSQPTINAVVENGMRAIRKGDLVSVRVTLVGDHNNKLPPGVVTVTPKDTSALTSLDDAGQLIDGTKAEETLWFRFIARAAGGTSLTVAYDSHPKNSVHVPPIDVAIGTNGSGCVPTYADISGCWTLTVMKGLAIPIKLNIIDNDGLSGTYRFSTTPETAPADGRVTGFHNLLATYLTLVPNPRDADAPPFTLLEVSDPAGGIVLCTPVSEILPPNPTFAQACKPNGITAYAQQD